MGSSQRQRCSDWTGSHHCPRGGLLTLVSHLSCFACEVKMATPSLLVSLVRGKGVNESRVRVFIDCREFSHALILATSSSRTLDVICRSSYNSLHDLRSSTLLHLDFILPSL